MGKVSLCPGPRWNSGEMVPTCQGIGYSTWIYSGRRWYCITLKSNKHDSVLGLCGTHERRFRHARALDTVLVSTQVVVGSAQHYDVNSRVLEV